MIARLRALAEECCFHAEAAICEEHRKLWAEMADQCELRVELIAKTINASRSGRILNRAELQ
jgi:hypothetical protein